MNQLVLQRSRLAGIALVAGGVLAIAGYVLAGTFVRGSGDARFTDPRFLPLYSIALVGAAVSVLGLPSILAAQGGRAARLTLVGYVGVFATLVLFNVAEGVVEAFVKPYPVTPGGIPKDAPTGLAVHFLAVTVVMVVGLISLGVAVLRAGVLPWWVGALLLASVPPSIVGQALPGPLAELGDYCAFLALIAIGWRVARQVGGRERRLAREVEAAA